MVEGLGKLLESGENAAAQPGDDGERSEEAASWPGEEGRKYEDAAGSGEGGVKSEDTDEDSDPDCPKGLIGYLLDTDFVESLPVKVKYRVLALKKLQTRVANLESKFLREFHEIERKFAEIYQPLLEKRRQIINAIYEPTEEECEYKSGYEVYDDEEMYDEEEMCGNEEGLVHEYMDEDDGYEEDYYDYAVEEEEDDDDEDNIEDDIEATGEDNKEDPKGIPDFWLTVLKNVDTVTPLTKKCDEPILKLLTDIKMKLSDPGEPLSFTLEEFHFKPNEYFKNALLTKTYVRKSRLVYYDPHPYRGTAVEYCTGCEIDWNEGKNVTLKTIKKKQKHWIWGTIRTVTEHFPKDSFFNFFTPYGISSNGKDGSGDFLLGHNLHTYIIPRSVLFFSGDALESQQEEVVRKVNDEIYYKIIYDNWMAAIEEVKTCCKNLEAMVEDIDR